MKSVKSAATFLLTALLLSFLVACFGNTTTGEKEFSPEESSPSAFSDDSQGTSLGEKETVSGSPGGRESQASKKEDDPMKEKYFYITANGTTFRATFADNSSAEALCALLKEGPLTVEMEDYGNFEKVGQIGHTLPRNDEKITTEPGDVILYLGTSITVYYDKNTWTFTRLGKIEDVTKDELLAVFGKGGVTMTFSLVLPQ